MLHAPLLIAEIKFIEAGRMQTLLLHRCNAQVLIRGRTQGLLAVDDDLERRIFDR